MELSDAQQLVTLINREAGNTKIQPMDRGVFWVNPSTDRLVRVVAALGEPDEMIAFLFGGQTLVLSLCDVNEFIFIERAIIKPPKLTPRKMMQ